MDFATGYILLQCPFHQISKLSSLTYCVYCTMLTIISASMVIGAGFISNSTNAVIICEAPNKAAIRND